MSQELRRYRLRVDDEYAEVQNWTISGEAADDGRWYRCADVDAEIAALRAERDELRHDMEVIRKGHEACERENDGLYATLTREPSEAEVDAVLRAIWCALNQGLTPQSVPGLFAISHGSGIWHDTARAAIDAFLAGRKS